MLYYYYYYFFKLNKGSKKCGCICCCLNCRWATLPPQLNRKTTIGLHRGLAGVETLKLPEKKDVETSDKLFRTGFLNSYDSHTPPTPCATPLKKESRKCPCFQLILRKFFHVAAGKDAVFS